MNALGIIEAIGISVAAAAMDAACKTSKVKVIGAEKVIGAGKSITVSIYLEGEVAAIEAAVKAGETAGKRVGIVQVARVIPRPYEDLIKIFIKKKKKDN